ncbi:MAG: BON domain-containing protein [Mariprofundaceae bacterium]
MLSARLTLVCIFLTAALLMSGCIVTAVVGGTAAASSAAFDERSAGSHFDDIALSGKIRARLIAEKDLPARWISVEVIDKQAVLTGYLPNKEQITRALRITRQTDGISSAQSKIKLGEPRASELLSDTWITTKVKAKLFDDPLTSGFSAHVETVNGEVYLQGKTKTDAERHRAADVAASVNGVSGVVNMLRTAP